MVSFNRYLELQSSGRKDEIRFHYKAQHEATAKMETFPFRLADNEWHKVAVSVSGAQVELLVDCHPLYRRIIRPLDRNFTVPQLGLWVGQRSRGHSFFKVSHQDENFLFPRDVFLIRLFVVKGSDDRALRLVLGFWTLSIF